MPSTYTTNLGLEKPATGEQAGVWGATVNGSYDFLDTGIDGSLTIPLSASAYTLLTNPGVDSVGRNKVVVFTGALTADGTISIQPNNAKKIYFVSNQTTGGFALNFAQGTGPTFRLLAGKSAFIYANGQGNAAGVFGVLNDFQCNSLLVQTNLIVQGQLQVSAPISFTTATTFTAAATFQAGATISPSLTLNLGSDAPYDIYYRAPAGNVARLPVGAPGQVLQVVAGGSLSWATLPAAIAIGGSISGSIANAFYFADGGATLRQDGNILARANIGIGLGCFPSHTLHLGYGLTPEIWLDTNSPTTAGQIRQVVWAHSGRIRAVLTASGSAESIDGTNTGGNLMFLGYNDAVTAAHTYFWLQRSTGNVSVGFGADNGARLYVLNDIVAQHALMVQGAPSQTGYLTLWQNSAGARVASIDNAGTLFAAGLSVSSLTVTTIGATTVNATTYQASGVSGTSVSVQVATSTAGQFVTLVFTGGILTSHTP